MKRIVSGLAALTLPVGLMLAVAPADAAVKYTVSISASAGRADVGRTITLRGKVSPNAKGQRVLVQQLNGSTWTTIKRPALNRLSKYAVSVKVTKGGDNKYRVVKPRSNGHPKGTSATVTIAGWRWRAVSSFPLSTLPGQVTYGTTHLGTGFFKGFPYSPFIKISSPDGNGYYNLNGKCTQLDTHVGGTDDSLTPDPSSAFLFASYLSDPNSMVFLTQFSVQRGDPYHVQRGPAVMTDVAILELRASGIEAGNHVGWGAARVYCKA